MLFILLIEFLGVIGNFLLLWKSWWRLYFNFSFWFLTRNYSAFCFLFFFFNFQLFFTFLMFNLFRGIISFFTSTSTTAFPTFSSTSFSWPLVSLNNSGLCHFHIYFFSHMFIFNFVSLRFKFFNYTILGEFQFELFAGIL